MQKKSLENLDSKVDKPWVAGTQQLLSEINEGVEKIHTSFTAVCKKKSKALEEVYCNLVTPVIQEIKSGSDSVNFERIKTTLLSHKAIESDASFRKIIENLFLLYDVLLKQRKAIEELRPFQTSLREQKNAYAKTEEVLEVTKEGLPKLTKKIARYTNSRAEVEIKTLVEEYKFHISNSFLQNAKIPAESALKDLNDSLQELKTSVDKHQSEQRAYQETLLHIGEEKSSADIDEEEKNINAREAELKSIEKRLFEYKQPDFFNMSKKIKRRIDHLTEWQPKATHQIDSDEKVSAIKSLQNDIELDIIHLQEGVKLAKDTLAASAQVQEQFERKYNDLFRQTAKTMQADVLSFAEITRNLLKDVQPLAHAYAFLPGSQETVHGWKNFYDSIENIVKILGEKLFLPFKNFAAESKKIASYLAVDDINRKLLQLRQAATDNSFADLSYTHAGFESAKTSFESGMLALIGRVEQECKGYIDSLKSDIQSLLKSFEQVAKNVDTRYIDCSTAN